MSWLLETDAVDQFAVQSDDPKKITIFANALPQPVVLEDRNVRHCRSCCSPPHFTVSPLYRSEMDREQFRLVTQGIVPSVVSRAGHRILGWQRIPSSTAVRILILRHDIADVRRLEITECRVVFESDETIGLL